MSDKVSPPTKPVGKSDGMKNGSEHSTITTPNTTMGRHYGPGKPASEVTESDSIFGKK